MKAPHFWSSGLDPKSREAAPLTRALLTPLTWLYLWGLNRKLASVIPEIVPVPVICIGNLTTGGTGKTPVAETIRSRITSLGHRAATLSRGHGGREQGPLKVDAAVHTFRDVGDEPLLLAATGEAWIGRSRVAAARDMASAGVEVVLMDDGHQNPSLQKDFTFVVIDAGAPFGNGHVLPKGPLRETIPAGLSRADAVILMGDGPVPREVAASTKPVLRARLESAAPVPAGRLVAFAGIGRPEKFFDSLKAAGADLRDAIPYADHHPYSAGDLDFLRGLARSEGALLITTAKDHVRLPAEMRAETRVHPVSAVFEDPEVLDALLVPIFKHSQP
ncbi:MAG: tetraacyldisaccharide 4'-kinase [Hyphomonas sp.]|uniref:tetraacyldisaccharide 4'-kinase n=1 Tax=Hyphomonas sp. TaxID=87 RepID=UPI00183DDA7B|nr:tetraacyldisaccharide 4'-kinase [Hyphomonas sp.]MBU3919988.1 tetraacyldisaccharide 4'-kinase [Alphaproteobacteria bacterium]MBA3067685.1 tetraacyldisaccharide 4'-kinase [Hyphomonas sp.]MBU4062228.1 tetraacyldisaccharide 4'-kinase [Alphaproteobacteria bacterium]MBU4165663.1 tetraacyldisaccharide 4'-kinase [Alphaproteobacteria bacterium]MBU4569120.1 tetraacyldisaccharide 4'-kinase [Alphaproteobacteria bacterium]